MVKEREKEVRYYNDRYYLSLKFSPDPLSLYLVGIDNKIKIIKLFLLFFIVN